MSGREVYFTSRETTDPSRSIIVPKDYDKFPFNTKTGGSYALAPARVLGLSYPDYLRFLMTMFPDDVQVRGKGSMYPIAYWKRDKALYTFLRLLNARMVLAMKSQEDNNE